jgi:hypothetical protein
MTELVLATEFEDICNAYFALANHILSHFGKDGLLKVWKDAGSRVDEAFLQNFMASGWDLISTDCETNPEKIIEKHAKKHFKSDALGLSCEDLKQLVVSMSPIPEILTRFDHLGWKKEDEMMTLLHFALNGQAVIAEVLVNHYGVKGELEYYDYMCQSRTEGIQPISQQAFFEKFASWHQSPERVVTKRTEREMETIVTRCEWADYLKARHPRVGYLMACCTDAALCNAYCSSVIMQCTKTLMAGDDCCHFKLVALDN